MLGVDDQRREPRGGQGREPDLLNGDPFDAGTEVEAVMLDGEFVVG